MRPRYSTLYKLLCGLLLGCAACQPSATSGAAGSQAYMQILYAGPNWSPGHPVLFYSPAFRGKNNELVADTDSTLEVAPTANLLDSAVDTTTAVVVANSDSVDFIPENDFRVFTDQGRLNPRYVAAHRANRQRQIAQERRDNAQELRSANRRLRLRQQRLQLSQDALTTALNQAAADGWEVVQMLNYGNSDQGVLLYLLKKR